jgi:hypothetical protein
MVGWVVRLVWGMGDDSPGDGRKACIGDGWIDSCCVFEFDALTVTERGIITVS